MRKKALNRITWLVAATLCVLTVLFTAYRVFYLS